MKNKLVSSWLGSALCGLLLARGGQLRADVLLNDGFPTGTDGYCTGTTKVALKNLTAASETIVGFAEASYTRGTGTIFAMPAGNGLALPQALVDAGLSATGEGSAAIGLQNSAQTAGTDKYRHQSRKISASLAHEAGETLFFRGLFKVDSASFSTLVAADDFTVANNYGMGLWNPTDTVLSGSNAYMTFITAASRFLYFNFAKTAAGTAQIRLTLKTGDGTVSTVALVDGATVGATYLCVAKIVYNDAGTQTVSAQAQRVDGFDLNTNYTVVGEKIALFDDSTFSLLFGGNYGSTGAATFDEFRLATKESEVTVPSQPATVQFASVEAEGKATVLNASVQLNTVDTGSVELKYGPSADNLTETLSCGTVVENGPLQVSLGEIFPQTWYGQLTISWDGGSYDSPVFSFVAPGIPAFSNVSVGGTLFSDDGIWAKATLSDQGFAETGVSVTLLIGDSEDALSATNVWTEVVSGSELDYALPDPPAPGGTVYCRFVASYEYQGQTVETASETVSVKCEGAEIWTGANGTDWHDVGNWSGLVVPNKSVDVRFYNGGGQVAAAADAFAKSIVVTNAAALALDMGGNTLDTDSFAMSRNSSAATLANGVYHLGAQKWPEAALSGMKLTIAADAEVDSSGKLAYCAADDHVSVYGKFNHTGEIQIGPRWGNSMTGSTLEVHDGGEVVVGSTLSIGWYNCKLFVLNGSSFKAAALHLGAGLSDQGSWALACVSNATLTTTGNLGVGTDDRTANSILRCYHDEGAPATQVNVGGDLYTSNSGGTMRNCQGNNIIMYGGTLNVKGNIRIDGTTINAARTNMLFVTGRETRITAASLTLNNNAQFKFRLPENGFRPGAVVDITGTCSFATENVRIVINASQCHVPQWQTLLSAGAIKGLTAENLGDYVTIEASYNGYPVVTKLVDNQLMAKVACAGLTIIVR
ncbi:MAG: hypothetical protein ACI4R9_04005 [Kiritimatiellia bacterium]